MKMAFTKRALLLLAIALSLQSATAYPNADKNKEETSESFSLINTMSSMWSFKNCREAASEIVNHCKEIHSIALDYVTLTSRVTSQSLRCIVSNQNGIFGCISGVLKDHRPSYDILHESLKALLKSLGNSFKNLVICPFH